jgi:GH25 family lysozyme M1 (1,4-beta-N-acetylmuramidase)
MSTTNLIIDVSAWQGNINFQKAIKYGVQGFIFKASQNNFKDSKFTTNWNTAYSLNLNRGAYHFYDFRKNGGKTPEQQAEYFVSTLGNNYGNLGLWLDFENFSDDLDRTESLEIIFKFSEKIKNLTGFYPGLYTNWSILKDQLYPIPNWLKKRELWLAAYPEISSDTDPFVYTKENDIFNTKKEFGWDKSMWQWGHPSVGKNIGVESKEVDCNWHYDQIELEDAPNSEIDLDVYRLTKVYNTGGYGVNVRIAPGIKSTKICAIADETSVWVNKNYNVSKDGYIWTEIILFEDHTVGWAVSKYIK